MSDDASDGIGPTDSGIVDPGGSAARARIRDYYETLRDGAPLAPYFADEAGTVKFGVSEALFGGEAVAAGLSEQTRTTTDWSVVSRRLTVTADGDTAWFADVVDLAWTDVASGDRRAFETRWSGSLRRAGEEWYFVGMHVSAAHDLDSGEVTGVDTDATTDPGDSTDTDGGSH